jgi:DNA-binding IclR family transcriptional regulator
MKAFAALSAVADRTEGISAKDLAEVTSMPLPTTYHLLQTLVDAGALSKGSGTYRLGSRIGQLADAYYENGELPEGLETALRDLAARTGETAYFSAWRRQEIQVIATAEGSRAVRVASLERGATGHAHARASGKLLLAHLSEDVREDYLSQHPLVAVTPNTIVDRRVFDEELERSRERGYAVDIEEFAPDVSCVAAPIVHSGRMVGVYTVSCPSSRFSREFDGLLSTLLEVCAVVGQHK